VSSFSTFSSCPFPLKKGLESVQLFQYKKVLFYEIDPVSDLLEHSLFMTNVMTVLLFATPAALKTAKLRTHGAHEVEGQRG